MLQTTSPLENIALISGSCHPELSQKIAENLNTKLIQRTLSKFADEETRVEIHENIRGKDLFIIQPTSRPANHHIMEALILIDAARRASAASITLVLPYYGYARQDRKSQPRTPIGASLLARLYETSGVDRVLCFELHNSAIQGFFHIPVDHLFVKPVFAEAFQEAKNSPENWMVVSPDAGGVERARALAKVLGTTLAIVDKRREKPNESSVVHVIGNVKDKKCILIDDIVDTGGSLVNAAEALKAHGAKSIVAATSHAVLSGDAVNRINKSCLDSLVVTDSIPLNAEAKKSPKIKQVTISHLLAESIRRIQSKESISVLFVA